MKSTFFVGFVLALRLRFGRVFTLTLGSLLIQVTLDGVEDAVDELGRFECREAARYFESLVYRDGARGGFVKKLVNGEPEDVPIDGGHAIDAPMLSA